MRGSFGEVLGKIFNGKNILTMIIALVIGIVLGNYLFQNAFGDSMNVSAGLFMISLLGVVIATFIIMFMVIQKWSFSFSLSEIGVILLVYSMFIGVMYFLHAYLNVDFGVFNRGLEQTVLTTMSIIGVGG